MTNDKNFQTTTLGAVAAATNAKLSGDPETPISDVTHDSRQAAPNGLFAAIRGLSSDGHRFIADVMRRGAAGVISELEKPVDFSGSWLQVENDRVALAQAANIVHGEPSHHLKLIGITGTNGKTTTTFLVNALANAAGEKGAMLTTVEYRIGETSVPAVRTTPEASDTQRFLRQSLGQGCSMAAMEASSQALDLHRCDALKFSVAVFTNLTRDHLDYHGTMENYFLAKKKLFDGSLGEAPVSSVINLDDEWGVRLSEELKNKGQRVITFALDREADLTASEIEVSILKGTTFVLKTPRNSIKVTSPLVGRPHVYNILSATATVLELGYDLEKIKKGIETCIGAPGRFERVAHAGDFAVVVDYAHTDDALLNVLKTARELDAKRVITVFGCGGDRDRSKRAPMGEIAGEWSDLAILTSDNPRTEDPLQILSEIEIGLEKTNCPYLKISDRREAIYEAIKQARTGDVVLIAGKGHETYQIIGADKFHFDDREIALEALQFVAEQ
ncbi:MAG TPA: UDP-N-acetylmuramoyl-L-alanyl-D-glutamate--2,6-diaminopimelate ligase [Pyrinomonadaceae bacterium]|nr:UDP-N-acetylmuramoyl-L-alanyl-D-glutamate--2,6-diaminopimelate ligase [Pyrinomonadaceae bacterium]